jgi:hypothetical protein
MNTTKLKIKIKSLSAETAFIRHEERARIWISDPNNPKGPRISVLRNPRGTSLGDSLYHHRIFDVGVEQRATLLAYGFLRGRLYRAVEPPCKCVSAACCRHRTAPWGRVESMVVKYGFLSKASAVDAIAAWRRGETPKRPLARVSAHHRSVQLQLAGAAASAPALPAP